MVSSEERDGARRTPFQAYVAQKTARAAAADLHALVTDTDIAPRTLSPIGNNWTRHFFDGNFYASSSPDAARPACSLVFVQSRDGNTGASDPFTLGGGNIDKHLIYEGLSQVAADAVLCGANTMRGADIVFGVWHPELVRLREALGKPRYPVQIIATRRGMNLDESLLFNVPELDVRVLTLSDGADQMRDDLASRPWVRPLIMRHRDDLAGAFETLRAQGIERVSSVGGRHLATQLIDAGLVQDVYLTTSATPGGEPGTPMYPRALNARTLVSKHGTGPDTGVRFEHLQL